MSANEDIKNAVRELSKTDDEVYSIVCTVGNINETEKTCDCTPFDGRAKIIGVRLMAENQKGILIVPKDGSSVVVSLINKSNGIVSLFSEIDKVLIEINSTVFEIKNNQTTFNDGSLGGLIKITDITTQINNRLNLIKTSILAALTAIDGSITGLGGAASGVTAWNTAIASYTPLNKSDYENTKVKHG